MERQSDGDGQETANASQRLSFPRHFSVVAATFLILAVATVTTVLVMSAMPRTGDKAVELLRHATIAGIEIAAILFIQSLLLDNVFDGKAGPPSERFRERAFQFGIKRPGNARVTARDTLLLLFCALVPLDAASYTIPGMLGYISNTSVGLFFDGFTLETFLTIGLAYNLVTGIKEELVFRGYFLQRFREQGTRHSAWIISSLLFGILHVQLSAFSYFPQGPIAWFGTAFLVGLLFSGYALNTGRLLPLVLAHGIGNFISAGSIWAYHATAGLTGAAAGAFLLAYYGPMLAAGTLLAMGFSKSIKRSIGAARRLGRALACRMAGSDWLVVAATVIVLWLCSFLLIF